MTSARKDQICALLKGIETGEEASVVVVNPDKYIQHNPQTREGGEGLAALFKRLSKSSPRVNIVRVFEDGDYVFAHTEYDFASSNIGFEIFRFEDDLAVEHWDNIQQRQGPNSSGHTMVEGPTEATDLDRTESNREIVRSFVDEVLINGQLDTLERYIVIMPEYDFAFPFINGMAIVCNDCRSESDGEHKVMVGGRWGVINKVGMVILPLNFSKKELLESSEYKRITNH